MRRSGAGCANSVARIFVLEEGTLANWRTSPKKRALLPYVKLGGGAIRYRAAVVDAFIAGSVVAA